MTKLAMRVGTFVEKHDLGELFSGDSGVYLDRDPDTVRGPDLHFVRKDNAGSLDWDSFLDVAPDLCIEIVSPSDKWSDIEEKVEQFLTLGSKLVWVMDPKTRKAHVRRSDGSREVIPQTGTLSGEDVLPGFTLALSELFGAVELQ